MATYRVHKTKDYTVMSNAHLRDKTLSLKGKGLLSVMLSLPDSWDYSINGLIAICKENETAVRDALKELKHCGYLVVTKMHGTSSGRFEYQYDIYESPQGVLPDVDNPYVGDPDVDNHTQYNTNILNTDVLNTEVYKETTKENAERFEKFWKVYPKKVSKETARKAFQKINPDDELTERMIKSIQWQKKTDQWSKENGKYIPHPATWLNAHKWEDEEYLSEQERKQREYEVDMSFLDD